MSALASAPYAANLEALHMKVLLESVVSPRWWEPLAVFSGLREFCLLGFGYDCEASEVDALADALAGLPALAVLDVGNLRNINLSLVFSRVSRQLKGVGRGIVL